MKIVDERRIYTVIHNGRIYERLNQGNWRYWEETSDGIGSSWTYVFDVKQMYELDTAFRAIFDEG